MRLINALLALAATTLVEAHPGHDPTEEMAVRREFLSRNKRNLDHCTEKLKQRGVTDRAIQRRQAATEKLREKRGLKKRVEQQHEPEYSFDTSGAEAMFSGNSSCVLSPETTEGPYYVTGESLRKNIVEDQQGLPMNIDVQIINTETCEPIVDAYLDSWQCNSTGVYGGVVVDGNGAGSSDPSNWETTWLRGVQPTDDDGVAEFETLFPGHYGGRTIHIHIMVHLNAELQDNGTLIDTTAAHVGQMYFDQDLIADVEQLQPYAGNQQPLTTNDQDFILQEDLAAGGTPFMEYSLVGDELEDGLVAWLTFGVNPEYTRDVCAIATNLAEGGHPDGVAAPTCG